eukprot:TRINITY_DN91623_c0_g1_i1.p1 TRINITY_DN91623_c0_g1~~TRINITY_DN91623_c0_g1_i1.p1  ORF type:complete len:541 (-),score=68.24 TRINITY_DN91623_c0_g1_i1:98-1720(-)
MVYILKLALVWIAAASAARHIATVRQAISSTQPFHLPIRLWNILTGDNGGASKSSLAACPAHMQAVFQSLEVAKLVEAGKGAGRHGTAFYQPWLYSKKWSLAKELLALPYNEQDEDYDVKNDLKWGDLISFSIYEGEKKRLKAVQRVSDESNVTALGVLSVCHLSRTFMKALSRCKNLLESFRTDFSECREYTLMQLQRAAQEALSELCFNSCSTAMEPLVTNCEADMDLPNLFNQEAQRQLLKDHEQCSELSYDTLEQLAEYTVEKKCIKFPPRTPLWDTDDKGFGDFSQTGRAAVCQVETQQKLFVRSKKFILQKGTCPEGTKCKCPPPQQGKQSTQHIRTRPGSLVRGIFAAASLGHQYATAGVLASTTAAVVTGGWLAMPFITASAALGVREAMNAISFTCTDTIGCWPNSLKSNSWGSSGHRCRAQDKAKKGLSPMWFLPPPGLIMKHSGGKCFHASCTAKDVLAQKIGFLSARKYYKGNPHVYNCQRLSYEEMTAEEREEFVRRVRETDTEEEYKDEYPINFTLMEQSKRSVDD